MPSSWSTSWGYSWDNSWGTLASLLRGSTGVVLQANGGSLLGSGILKGATDIVFTTEGSLRLRTPIRGSFNFTLGNTGNLGGTANLKGNTDISFVVSSALLTAYGFMRGTANQTFVLTATLFIPDLPYELEYSPTSEQIYEINSGSGPFLYYETSGTSYEEIYEEN